MRVAGAGSEGRSGRFRRVPVCAGVGSGGKFRKVPEGSGVCWCKFRRQVPEGAGGFRCVCAVVDSGRLWRVPESSGAGWCRFRRQVAEGSSGGKSVRWCIGSGGRVRKVRESSGVVCCLATLTGAAMWLFWTPFGDDILHMGNTTAQKKCRPCGQTWHDKDLYMLYIYMCVMCMLLLLGTPPKLILKIFLASSLVNPKVTFFAFATLWIHRLQFLRLAAGKKGGKHMGPRRQTDSPKKKTEQATTRVRKLEQTYNIYASASALPACLSHIFDTNFPQANLTMKPTNQNWKKKKKTAGLEEGSVFCKYTGSCKKQCMVCTKICSLWIGRRGCAFRNETFSSVQKETISLKRMIWIAISKLYGLCIYIYIPVCINLPTSCAYLSCLLLIYFWLVRFDVGEDYGRDIRHGILLVKNWVKA